MIKLADQPGKIDWNQMQFIIEGLKQLNLNAIYVKECWESLGSPMEIKSILGLLDEFKYISMILDSELYDNPSMNCGLYRVDQDMLDQLKKAIFTAREEKLEEIFVFINTLSQVGLIDDKKKEELLQRHATIKENLEG